MKSNRLDSTTQQTLELTNVTEIEGKFSLGFPIILKKNI